MKFSDIVKARYASKLFDGRKIPESKVERLLELVRLAPSSLNLQPWKIIVISDDGLKKELSKASYGQPQVSTCSHLLVFCADTDFEALAQKLEGGLSKAGMPKESVRSYMEMVRGFIAELPEEKRLPWAQRQLYLALSNAINGAKSLGFDSCPMEGFEPEKYSAMLRLPKNIVPTALVSIGYAKDQPRPKYRFPKEEIFLRPSI